MAIVIHGVLFDDWLSGVVYRKRKLLHDAGVVRMDGHFWVGGIDVVTLLILFSLLGAAVLEPDFHLSLGERESLS